MEQVLLVVQVIVTLALIAMVLLQRSDSDGFGLGSGGGGNLLSGRASANLMTRTTAILAALFIINSLVLSVMAAHNKPASIIDAIKAQEASTQADDAKVEAKTGAVPAAKDAKPAVPTAGATSQSKPVVTDETAPAAKPVKKAAKKVESTPAPAPAEEE